MKLEEKIRTAYWIDLGKSKYDSALELQSRLVELRKEEQIPDVIICTEHFPVISFGSRGKYNQFEPSFLEEVKKNKGAVNEDAIISYLNEKGIGFSKTNRGGGSTYHGPGQIVIYLVVDYEKIAGPFGIDRYQNLLDQIMLSALKKYEINANSVKVSNFLEDLEYLPERENRKDIWLIKNKKNFKIGAKGIRSSKNVSMYGFALYAQKECLDGFKMIYACGYPKEELDVTCIENETSMPFTMEGLKDKIKKSIAKHFRYDLVEEKTLRCL